MTTSIFDLFQLIASNAWLYGGAFVLVLSVLVFVHEFGHYYIARLCGVRVESFSIGFGPEIFGINDKHGTRWKFSIIPLGGYVKMFGDTDPASAGHTDQVEGDDGAQRPLTKAEREEAFFSKPVWQRAAIVFAGPAINFLFAIILLAGLYMTHGQVVTSPVASIVMEGGAADKAGFQPHDKILAIEGDTITRFEDIRRYVMIALDTPTKFTIERDGEVFDLTATPRKETLEDRFGFKHSRGLIGIYGPGSALMLEKIVSVDGRKVENIDQARDAILRNMDQSIQIQLDSGTDKEAEILYVKPLAALNEALKDPDHEDHNHLVVSPEEDKVVMQYGFFSSIGNAVRETGEITASTLKALGQMITGTRNATELGGIIRIGAIAGDMAQAGLIALITFTALLSINLGLINLFPIPMLDGGHLVFYAVEAVKGSPISDNVQEYAFRLGLVVLVGIMLFANLNDIAQLFSLY